MTQIMRRLNNRPQSRTPKVRLATQQPRPRQRVANNQQRRNQQKLLNMDEASSTELRSLGLNALKPELHHDCPIVAVLTKTNLTQLQIESVNLEGPQHVRKELSAQSGRLQHPNGRRVELAPTHVIWHSSSHQRPSANTTTRTTHLKPLMKIPDTNAYACTSYGNHADATPQNTMLTSTSTTKSPTGWGIPGRRKCTQKTRHATNTISHLSFHHSPVRARTSNTEEKRDLRRALGPMTTATKQKRNNKQQ